MLRGEASLRFGRELEYSPTAVTNFSRLLEN
jgi:hypothetical protein